MKRISKLIATLTLGVAMMMPTAAEAASSNVERLDGRTRVETSIAVSKKAYADGTATDVVLAGYQGEADALTGTLLASSKDAPLLLIHKFDSDMKKEFQRLGVQTVHLLGGESVLSKSLEKEIEDAGYTVKRVAGSGRFETAVEVANASAGNNEHAFLTNDGRSGSLADALAVGPVSGRDKNPILLTSKDKLPDSTLNAMKAMNTKSVTIIGGPGAVGKNVENALQSANIRVDRIAGDERWDTARRIANRYFKDSKDAIVTNDGRISFADALMGGYLGAKKNAPILLTQAHQINYKTTSVLINDMTNVLVLGGPSVVEHTVSKNIERILKGEVVGDVEPNNSFKTASSLKLNSRIDGDLPKGDVDYFRIELPSEGTLQVNLLSQDGINLALNLYNHDYRRVNRVDAGTASNFSRALKPGTYYIKVNPTREGENGAYELKTTFTKSTNTAEGAGADFQNSKPIDLGETVRGTIGYGAFNQNTVDYFKVEVPSEGRFEVYLASLEERSLHLEVYNENRQSIDSRNYSSNSSLVFGLRPGVYYIRVSPERHHSSYNLHTKFTPSINSHEGAGGTFGNAKKISVGEEIKATIGYRGNSYNPNDFYAIEVPKAGTLNINLAALDTGEYTGDLGIELYNGNYQLVDREFPTAYPRSSNAVQPGTYYLKITRRSTAAYGSYNLVTELKP